MTESRSEVAREWVIAGFRKDGRMANGTRNKTR